LEVLHQLLILVQPLLLLLVVVSLVLNHLFQPHLLFHPMQLLHLDLLPVLKVLEQLQEDLVEAPLLVPQALLPLQHPPLVLVELQLQRLVSTLAVLVALQLVDLVAPGNQMHQLLPEAFLPRRLVVSVLGPGVLVRAQGENDESSGPSVLLQGVLGYSYREREVSMI
jgi:hypothetical protein